MPIYEYICSKCQAAFEKLVPSHSSPVDCPECGSKKVERQFSTFAAHGGGSSLPCKSGMCPGAMGGSSPCSGGRCPMSH